MPCTRTSRSSDLDLDIQHSNGPPGRKAHVSDTTASDITEISETDRGEVPDCENERVSLRSVEFFREKTSSTIGKMRLRHERWKRKNFKWRNGER